MPPAPARSAVIAIYLGALLLAAAAVTGYWYWQGRPVALPDVAGTGQKLQCVSYSPFAKDQNPMAPHFQLRPAQMDADLALLSQYFTCIRTYSMTGMAQLPAIARRHGLKVMLGAWVNADPVATKREIDLLIRTANRYPDTVQSVVVGNEVLLRKEMSGPRLAALIRYVKQRVPQPVTYADVWDFWDKHPEVAPAVDFITIHLLPYWENQPVGIDEALAKVARIREHYQRQYAPKDIMIGETGWPSWGRQRETAVPSRVNEAKFIRGFVAMARSRGWHYNLIEAFDQPWKRANEGAVGGYWGLFDADRHDKHILAGAVSNLPDYPLWLALSLAVAGAGLVLGGRPANRRRAALLPVLAAVAGVCQAAWWVQAVYADRNSWEWLWTLAVSALNGAVLAHAALALGAGQGARSRWLAALEPYAPRLLLGAGFVTALLSIQLAFDGRYRLFSPCAIALPALVYLLLPTRLPAGQARLLGWITGLSLPWLLWQETPANTQALGWIFTAAVMTAVLYRAGRTSRNPAISSANDAGVAV